MTCGRRDVRDHLFGCIDALLRELPITYLKWDHNRDLAPAGGAAQMRGAYELFARVRAAHPALEIEACAGGGGRNDAGMADYCHRYWTSDNIDAASRIGIQRGFLSFLPPEVMGIAHRRKPRPCHGAQAFPGLPGCHGDGRSSRRGNGPAHAGHAERAELADWIAFHKQWRGLLHQGTVWLGEGADAAFWQAQGNAAELLLFVIRADPPLTVARSLCHCLSRARMEHGTSGFFVSPGARAGMPRIPLRCSRR